MKKLLLALGFVLAGLAPALAQNAAITMPTTVTINTVACTLGSSCTITASATQITVGTTTVSGGTNGDIEFNNSGVLGEKGVTGSGSVVLGTSPSISGLTVTGSLTATGLVTAADLFGTTGSGGNVVLATAPTVSALTVTGSLTATGLVTNADLANASTTVNGTTCTLGSTCTVTATAGSITVGTTTISGGTSGYSEVNNGGVLGEAPISGKNRLINGDPRVDQRNAGASQTITSTNAYTVDRWYAACTGANCTGQQEASPLAGYSNAYKFTGAASNTAVKWGQRIESKNISDLVSSSVAGQIELRSSTITTVTWTAYFATATDNFTSETQIATGTCSITASFSKCTFTFNAGASAGNGVDIVFTTGALLAAQTLEWTGAQLEAGSTATAFEFRQYGESLFLSQRYVYPLVGGFMGYANGTTVIDCGFTIPVPMRTVPTVIQGTNLGIAVPSSAVQSSQSISFPNNITQYGGMIRFNNFTGLTSGSVETITPNGATTFQTAYFALLSAEL